MSSSCRNRSAARTRRLHALVRALLVGGGAAAAAPAALADTYFTPDVWTSAEYHTNRDLTTDPGASTTDQKVAGYTADLSGTFGVRSQRGNFEVRPELMFQNYPDRDDLERTNRYLDMRGTYASLRSNFGIVGRYSFEDEYKSQLPEAIFDSFDPQDPNTGDTGRIITVSQHVQRIYVRPSFEHQFTQRLLFGASVDYESVDFNINTLDRIDYDNGVLTGYLGWNVGQRSQITTGLYYSKFETDQNINNTDATGVSLGLSHSWTETFSGSITVSGERTETEFLGSAADKSDNFAVSAQVEKRTTNGRLRFEGGRSFRPTGNGSRAAFDQLRVAYNRTVTQRWGYGLAVRGFRTSGDDVARDDRDYLRFSLDVSRQLTMRWYASAGYDFLWQKYELDTASRKDHSIHINVGYRGLDPQR